MKVFDTHVHWSCTEWNTDPEWPSNDIKTIDTVESVIGTTDILLFPINAVNRGPNMWGIMGGLILDDLACSNPSIDCHYLARYNIRWANTNSVCEERQRGAEGVKIIVPLQRYMLNKGKQQFDKILGYINGIIANAAELNMPVLLHTQTGEEEWHPNKVIWDIVSSAPRCTFILGHSGMHDLENVDYSGYLDMSNVYLETSICGLNDKITLLKKTGGARVVFGSDMPYSDPRHEYGLLNQAIKAVGLEQKTEEIFYENARKLLPRPERKRE